MVDSVMPRGGDSLWLVTLSPRMAAPKYTPLLF